MLFGNLGALAMAPLGSVAGTGASVIASLTSAVSVAASALTGFAYDLTLIPFATAIVISALLSLSLVFVVSRYPDEAISAR